MFADVSKAINLARGIGHLWTSWRCKRGYIVWQRCNSDIKMKLERTRARGLGERWIYLTMALMILLPSRPIGLDWHQNHADVLAGATKRSHSVMVAQAAYLDDVGQMSHVMSEFIELLLDKVSFLAEIVIESSLEEDCQSSCSRPATEANNGSKAAALVEPLDRHDGDEFRGAQMWYQPSTTKSSGGASNGAERSPGCRLFGLSLEQRDLPVSGMESCCLDLDLCYGQCGTTKTTCDSTFRACLRSMCKLKFDYMNDSLVSSAIHELRRREASLQLAAQYEPLVDDADLEEEQLYGLLDSDINPNNGEEMEQLNRGQNEERLLRRHTENASMGGAVGSEQGGRRGPAAASAEPDERERKKLKDKYKACKLASKLLIIGNLAFTCQTYRQMQRLACCNG